LLSLIILSFNSSKTLIDVYKHFVKHLEIENIPFEIVIMDDGSDDKSFEIAQQLTIEDSRVSAYQLSRNFSTHYSIFAGLTKVSGKCAVPIPDDFQVPVETILEMYRLWENGNKIIVPYRKNRDDGFIVDAFSNLYYKIMNNFSEINFPKGGSDLFLIDQEIIDIINRNIHPKNTSTIVEVLRLGFSPVFIPMSRHKSVNEKSRWTFKKKIKLALDTFISTSSFPIKLISFLGIISSIISFTMIFYYIYAKLTGMIEVPGWTLIVIYISLFNGLILFSLGIIAEYIWRIFEEVKDRPGYIIKKNSK